MTANIQVISTSLLIISALFKVSLLQKVLCNHLQPKLALPPLTSLTPNRSEMVDPYVFPCIWKHQTLRTLGLLTIPVIPIGTGEQKSMAISTSPSLHILTIKILKNQSALLSINQGSNKGVQHFIKFEGHPGRDWCNDPTWRWPFNFINGGEKYKGRAPSQW